MNPESMYSSFKGRMNVNSLASRNSFFRNEGLISVTYVTEDIDLGREIINYANNIFLIKELMMKMRNLEKQLALLKKIYHL